MDILFKLPKQIMEHHGIELRTHDWDTKPSLLFNFGGQFFHLEMIARDGQRIVRSATVGSANRLRKYALTLGPDWKPSDEEVEAVLAKRNPKPEADEVGA